MTKKASDTLHVAKGVSFDADYLAGRSLAMLGKRGAGKTFACRVLAEEFVAAHVQTVIVDPMGVFWGLRSSADGHHEGLPIPVFGGEHGDAPLESTAGSLMADLAVEEGLSMVLDLSQFPSRTQERSFAAAFFDRLYRHNKHLLHLIVDEADLFGPQKPRREDAHLLVTLENIVRRGRNKGIGITMASQRAAVLNKDLLTQVDVLAAMRVTAPQDRAAIQEWVRGQGDDDEWSKIAPSLPGLATGEAWWWAPEKGVLTRVQGRAARTFDSSPTRVRGQSAREPKTFADVDLAGISDRIAATVERTQRTDPQVMARKIIDLERALAAAQTKEPAVQTVEVPVQVEVPVVPDGLTEWVASTEEQIDQALTGLHAVKVGLRRLVGLVTEEVEQQSAPSTEAPTADRRPEAGQPDPRPLEPSAAARRAGTDPEAGVSTSARVNATSAVAANGGDGATVSPARRNLLTALASLATIDIAPAQKVQLALWAGVSSKSSGYANNLGALRTAGLIDYPVPGMIALTVAGNQHVDLATVTTMPTDQALHQHVQSLLPPARWRLIEQLLAAYPEPLSKADLADRAGVSPASSGYSNNLGALRSMGLVDYPSPGHVAPTGVLFLGQAS